MAEDNAKDLITHVLIFAIVAIGLLFFDVFDNGSISWSLWPVGGWLIGLLVHSVYVWRS